jgi:hypothetical protein
MENSTRFFLRLRRNGAGGDGRAIETERRASLRARVSAKSGDGNG